MNFGFHTRLFCMHLRYIEKRRGTVSLKEDISCGKVMMKKKQAAAAKKEILQHAERLLEQKKEAGAAGKFNASFVPKKDVKVSHSGKGNSTKLNARPGGFNKNPKGIDGDDPAEDTFVLYSELCKQRCFETAMETGVEKDRRYWRLCNLKFLFNKRDDPKLTERVCYSHITNNFVHGRIISV
jgi:hypothetical protein